MLSTRLQQIKIHLEEKRTKSSRISKGGYAVMEKDALSDEEEDLLKELTFLETNKNIQQEFLYKYGKDFLVEMIAPPPTICSACGRPFKP